MEKFGAYADRTTGRMPFAEQLPDSESMGPLRRFYSRARRAVVSPLLLALRLPLLLLVLALWLPWSLAPARIRPAGDALFARTCLFCFGCYRVGLHRCTRSDRFVRDAPEVPGGAVIAGRLTSPLDVLVLTWAFRPRLVLLPYKVMSSDGRLSPSAPGRLFPPCLAFLQCCRFDLCLHAPLTAVERDLERSRSGAPEKSARSAGASAFVGAGFEPSASDALEARRVWGAAEECSRLLIFPEGCFSNGSVVLSSLLPDSLVAQRPVVCAAVDRPWVYRSLAHPFPTLETTLLDLGEPVANVRVSAALLPAEAGAGMARVSKLLAHAAGVSVASLTLLDREAFYQRNIRPAGTGEPETPKPGVSGVPGKAKLY